MWVLFSTLAIGEAICARLTPLTRIALLGYGAAAGVAVHGLFGLLVARNWHTRCCTVGALLFLAVFRLRRTLSYRAFSSVILLQLACNAGLLWMRGCYTGVRRFQPS